MLNHGQCVIRSCKERSGNISVCITTDKQRVKNIVESTSVCLHEDIGHSQQVAS